MLGKQSRMFISSLTQGTWMPVLRFCGYDKGSHTRTVLPSVLTAQLNRECFENSVRFAVKIYGLCNFRNGRNLTAQFTLGCSVYCVLKAEANLAQFGLRS
jgi:hypothetical protein